MGPQRRSSSNDGRLETEGAADSGSDRIIRVHKPIVTFEHG